jgi:hypothetical protein
MDNPNNNIDIDSFFDDAFNNNAPIQTPIEEPAPQQPAQAQPEVQQATRIPKNQQVQMPNNQPVQQPTQQPVQQPAPQAQSNNQQMRTDGSTQQNLAILMNIQDYYKDVEWTQKYAVYMQECSKIEVDPMNLTASDIAVAAGRIDALLTPARFDYALMNKVHGHYEMLLKLQQQIEYGNQKRDDENAKVKHSIDDTKALAMMRVKNNTSYEDNLDLFSLEDKYAGRMIQAKTILDILSDKKDILITYSAALKIENTANNFTASVPTNNQFNQMRS